MPTPARHAALRAVCLGLLLMGSACSERASERPRAILLVIGDDHAWHDFGFMGSTVAQTPTLDTLAAEGFVFENGYNSASVCRPSMRTLLTGLEPFQWEMRVDVLESRGIVHRRQQWVREFATLPRLLAASGYATVQAGKLWEGETIGEAGFTHGVRPPGEGFPLDRASQDVMRETLGPVFSLIDEVRSGPFFVWLAPMLPHEPHDPPDHLLARYAETQASFRQRNYLASVTRFDEGLGQMLDFLRERDELDDLLIVYLADNGWHENPELGKNSFYDLGFRTPIILWWPGRIEPGRSQTMVAAADVFATLADYAGVEMPVGPSGKSLRPVVERRADSVRDAVFGRQNRVRGRAALGEPRFVQGGRFARTARWHYLLRDDGSEELFDIAADPHEQSQVGASFPEVRSELRARIEEWEREQTDAVEALP